MSYPAAQQANWQTLPLLEAAPFKGTTSWSQEEAYRYCLWVATNHYENFPVASLFLPTWMRPHVAAVYAFARTADDIADEADYQGSRMELLELWRKALHSIAEPPRNELQHPVFVALAATIEKFALPIELLDDLLTAFMMDVTIHDYETFDDLLGYCRCSANPVGRLVLHLFGYRNDRLMQFSDSICTALQLANFWQDVSVDLAKPRIYLPQADIRHFGYSREELEAGFENDAFRELITFQVERTEQIFHDGWQLIRHLRGRLQFEIALTWFGGRKVLEKIRSLHYNVLHQRPTLNTMDKCMVLGQALRYRKGGAQ